jgi:hypothetical protein
MFNAWSPEFLESNCLCMAGKNVAAFVERGLWRNSTPTGVGPDMLARTNAGAQTIGISVIISIYRISGVFLLLSSCSND